MRDPALAIAHATMESLLAHQLSPTPENYHVWFSFHAGEHPGLCAQIRDTLATGRNLSQPDMDAWYARVCAEEPHAAAVGRVAAQVEASLQEAVRLLETARASAHRYGHSLAGLSGTLAGSPPGLTAQMRRVLDETRELCQTTRSLAERLAARAREAEELRSALNEARRDALTDPLTGLPNRRGFEDALSAPGAGDPLCVVVLDVDHFKKVNDRQGHAAGDAVLQGLARTLREWSRPDDTPARTGGEEFAVLLPRLAAAAALPLVERLRETVAATSYGAGGPGNDVRITISAGLAEGLRAEGAEALMARADAALYRAKHEGRNRVRLAPAPRAGGADAPHRWDQETMRKRDMASPGA